VPWSLAATVGEWHFTLNVHDPDSVIDEHWYMTPYYAGREDYWKTPRNHLHGTGLAITDYIAGPLEDWTNGALRLAAGTTLVVPGADRPPYSYSIGKETRTAPADVQASADVSTDDLLIEAYLRTTQRDGSIVAKLGRCGYALELADGRPRLRLRIDGTDALVAMVLPPSTSTARRFRSKSQGSCRRPACPIRPICVSAGWPWTSISYASRAAPWQAAGQASTSCTPGRPTDHTSATSPAGLRLDPVAMLVHWSRLAEARSHPASPATRQG
jgi:hypothetical protein